MAVRDVVLQINGGQHILRSDLGAWAAVEDLGEDYIALIRRLDGEVAGPKMRTILLLLWAYLDHERPRPALDDVKRWVTTENFAAVTMAVVQAYRDGLPEDVPKSPPEADAGTGQPSASSAPA